MTPAERRLQVVFGRCTDDHASEVTWETVNRMAALLGMKEAQVIHRALCELAVKILPKYERDKGPLTASQIGEICQRIPQRKKRSVSSDLFEPVSLARLRKFRGRLPVDLSFDRDKQNARG